VARPLSLLTSSRVLVRALLLACAFLPTTARASLTGPSDVARPIPELSTALPRELPGPCADELCGELEAPQPKTRVRGFELDLYCRLGGEGDLSCRPRQVWLERYDGSASERSVFTGHYFDTETNLYYAKARYFDPELGRFLSQDSYLGELTEPPSLHRYLYAFDNPIRYYDPTGNETEFTQLGRMDAEIKRQEKERDWCSSNPDACAAKAAASAEADRVALVRTLGMVQALGGVAQVGLGAAALGAPEPTGATKVAGWVAVVRGIDNTLTGVRQVFSGQVEEPVTQRGARTVLEKAGASPATAQSASQWAGVIADAGSTAQVSKALTPVVARVPLTPATPRTGETTATRIGREAHAAAAAERRAGTYGKFEMVDEPFRDASGEPVLVPRRVDLKTGEPQPGAPMQEAIPDAVSFERSLVMDDKPLGRPIAKDRQELIRHIRAFEAARGHLPNRIAIPRYDPSTGQFVRTDLYKPEDFLPSQPPK